MRRLEITLPLKRLGRAMHLPRIVRVEIQENRRIPVVSNRSDRQMAAVRQTFVLLKSEIRVGGETRLPHRFRVLICAACALLRQPIRKASHSQMASHC
jgi:hypothetical protein